MHQPLRSPFCPAPRSRQSWRRTTRIAAEEKAERDRIAAVEAERRRVAQAEAAKKAEEDARAADKVHRGRINREALAGFIAAGLDEVIARLAVEAIVKGTVPHVSIGY